MQLTCRIPNHGDTRWHIPGHHGAHPHNSASTNDQWRSRGTLTNDCARTDVSVILDMDIAIAMDAGRECNEVADHAVMFYVTVKIGMKMLPDLDVTRERYKGAKNRTRTEDHSIHFHDVGSPRLEKLHTVILATSRYAFTNLGGGDRQTCGPKTHISIQPIHKRNHRVTIDRSRRWFVINEDQLHIFLPGKLFANQWQHTSPAATRSKYGI